MVQAVRQTVRIQPGGKLEPVSAELPEGVEAEVIVLLPVSAPVSRKCWGLFADEPELLDHVVAQAMACREHPLRLLDEPIR